MNELSEKISYVMRCYCKKSKNAAKTCRKIYEVYEENTVSERNTQ